VEEAVRTLADITLRPENDDLAFRTGNLWLGRYLEQGKLGDGRNIDLPSEYMDDVSKRMKERELRMAVEEVVLRNVPLKAPAIKSRAPAMGAS
jgi:hypothetical protein